jgi:Fungal rhodopsin domain
MLFLFRLTGQKKTVKRAILALLVVNGVATFTNLFFVIFQCLPIQATWDRFSYPDAKCLPFSTVTTAFASISVMTDFMALLVPTWIVYDLKIGRRQKALLIGILSFGLM